MPTNADLAAVQKKSVSRVVKKKKQNHERSLWVNEVNNEEARLSNLVFSERRDTPWTGSSQDPAPENPCPR